MGALRYKQTKTSDAAWTEQAIPNADSHADAYAYQDTERNSYKLPHHFLNQDGSVGEASTKACQQAIAYLNSEDARKAMSDEDIAMAYNHLAAHLRDAGVNSQQLNGIEAEGTHSERITLEENSFEVDAENGRLIFPGGQVIMDGRELRSGLSYEMETLDPSEFNGSVTEDHIRRVRNIVAKTKMYKRGDELVIDYLQFAVKENPDAVVDFALYANGYAKDMSIETYGPWPDEEGKFKKAKVIGHSLVVVGNSKSARINSAANEVIANALATAKANNLDIADLEQELGVKAKQSTNSQKEDIMLKTIKNNQSFAVSVKYKNAAGDEAENSLAAGATIDVTEDQAEAVENQIKNAVDPANKPLTTTDLNSAVENALKDRDAKHSQELEDLKKQLAKNNAEEPAWRPTDRQTARHGASGKLEEMHYADRTKLQLQSLWEGINGNAAAADTARAIRDIETNRLVEAGLAENAVDLPALRNFVIPPEMVKEIKEQASEYSPLLSAFSFEETLSLETAWLTGTGDIIMDDVDMNTPESGDGDRKPNKKPTFATDKVELKEFAAITPVKTSALRFAAVDLVGHINKLYSRAYQRALATSIIGRLQKAVDANGNVTANGFTGGDDIDALLAMVDSLSNVAEHSPNGLWLMTEVSRLQLFRQALKAGQGEAAIQLFTKGADSVPQFLGKRYVVVPSDLMPNLNTAGTKTLTFEGTTATVDSGIILADPTNLIGRVSGGLNFQVSDNAAYTEGENLRSSWERDEIVFRGFGYRATGVYFENSVAAIQAQSGPVLS